MKSPQQIAASIPFLSLPESHDLIAELTVEREKYLRRTVVAELALKRLVRELNPNLSDARFEAEMRRILDEAGQDGSEVLMQTMEERRG